MPVCPIHQLDHDRHGYPSVGGFDRLACLTTVTAHEVLRSDATGLEWRYTIELADRSTPNLPALECDELLDAMGFDVEGAHRLMENARLQVLAEAVR